MDLLRHLSIHATIEEPASVVRLVPKAIYIVGDEVVSISALGEFAKLLETDISTLVSSEAPPIDPDYVPETVSLDRGIYISSDECLACTDIGMGFTACVATCAPTNDLNTLARTVFLYERGELVAEITTPLLSPREALAEIKKPLVPYTIELPKNIDEISREIEPFAALLEGSGRELYIPIRSSSIGLYMLKDMRRVVEAGIVYVPSYSLATLLPLQDPWLREFLQNLL